MNYKKIAVKEKIKNIAHLTNDSFLNELLAQRGINDEISAKQFLNPSKDDFIDPFAFSDMQKAKDRILDAIKNQETILVWGDFDCDGVTSTSILYKTLSFLGANVITFIPDRLLHGHGLNSKELIKFISKDKIKLVITVDCAISDISQVNLLRSLKIDTIITDHHTTDCELPNAYAIINPQVKGAIKDNVSANDIESLCYNSGSAVAFKLALALLNSNDNKEKEDLITELQLIASVGIVADVVPLLGENRAMVKYALDNLNSKKENLHYGIYSLLNKNCPNKDFTSYDIAFILAPRINAVGRLNNAKLSFEFLTTKDKIKQEMIIEQLDNYNKIRQSKCAQTYDEIIDYLNNHKEENDNPAIILMNKDWHIGIIGIVASKIVENFHKPCFLMTIDENNSARCSIRSNETINVYQVLKENEKLFSGFGGHKLAGGCSFNLDEISFETVKKSLLDTVRESYDAEKEDKTLWADVEVDENALELNILETIEKLEPFGQNNPMPLFMMSNVHLDEFSFIGKEKNHLRMFFSKNDRKFQCVSWNEKDFKIPLNSVCDIAFYPRLNDFNGEKNIQLEINDVYCENIEKQINSSYKIFDHRRKTGILDSISQYLEKCANNIGIWAKSPKTKQELSNYKIIKDNFIEDYSNETKKGIMFFDYPSSDEELYEILSNIKPTKIHFMNYEIDENLENYVKQIFGMVKYCSNKLQGIIDISKMAHAVGLNETCVHLSLEIMENLNSIEILNKEKLNYLKPFQYQDFRNDSLFELLNEEFENVINYKKNLLNCDIAELEKIVANIIS